MGALRTNTNLNESNDEPSSSLVQLLIAPGGVLRHQPVAPAVVLLHKQRVQGHEAKVFVGSEVCQGNTGVHSIDASIGMSTGAIHRQVWLSWLDLADATVTHLLQRTSGRQGTPARRWH